MIRSLLLAGSCAAALASGSALSQELKTPADAFKAGQDFSKGSKGKAAASGAITTTTGGEAVPKYNTTPPEAGVFGGGKALIGGIGNSKVAGCKDYKAGSAYDQQECNAVNFLNQRDRTNKFTIDKAHDPLMVNSKDVIANPGTAPVSGQAACHVLQETIPGTFTTETCEESSVLTSLTCKKTLIPTCAFAGAPISDHRESKSGAVDLPTLTTGSAAGLYDYNIQVGYSCGSEGAGEITFNLDTVGQGGYLTINLSSLDDTAAIGVNDTTVFAGYPNAGPQYSGAFFPTARKDFQIGYSWSEDVGAATCAEYDGDGYCVRSVWVPDVRSFYANTKLLDYCPSGYTPTSQRAYAYCDSDGCSGPSSYTPNNVGGFFCNADGKFLMNRNEGIGAWGGSVSSVMPLQTGTNTIRVYWGTVASGKACGTVRVSGQIFNVAPSCSAQWDDQCASARESAKPQ